MPLDGKYAEFLKVVDSYIADSTAKIMERGRSISCGKGCSNCCYLMVEVNWTEAVELARWISERPIAQRLRLRQKVRRAAAERRRFFAQRESTKRYCQPTSSAREPSERVCDEYFYGRARPCPLLEDGVCSVYPARPTACRLHMATSDRMHCARSGGDFAQVVIPKEINSARRKVEQRAIKALPDPRWGELSIMLDYIFSKGLDKPQVTSR